MPASFVHITGDRSRRRTEPLHHGPSAEHPPPILNPGPGNGIAKATTKGPDSQGLTFEEDPDADKWPQRAGSDECHCTRAGMHGNWRVTLDCVREEEGRVDERVDGGGGDEIGFLWVISWCYWMLGRTGRRVSCFGGLLRQGAW